jgi:hypothetical protein
LAFFLSLPFLLFRVRTIAETSKVRLCDYGRTSRSVEPLTCWRYVTTLANRRNSVRQENCNTTAFNKN